jgi:hypothetical protein
MAIRMGKDHAFEATGSALQFLGNRARPNDIQGRVAVRQPAAVQHAVTGCVEGLLGASESGIRRQARTVLRCQSTLLKIPPKLAKHDR